MKRRELYTGRNKYAYIAFHYQDGQVVEPLLDILDGNGYRYWMNFKKVPDEGDLVEIAKKVTGSSVSLLVLTKNSVSDPIISSVIEMTVNSRKQLVVYLATDLPEVNKYLDSLLHYNIPIIVYRPWEQSFMDSNSVKQALEDTKGLTVQQAKMYYDYGISYFNKEDATQQEIASAFQFISASAENEYIPAMSLLGKMHLNNARSGKEAYSTSIMYLKLAADKGDIDSIYTLGCMIYDGEGFTKNPMAACGYISLAAIRNNADAQYRFAEMLENGIGVNVDRKEATKWYRNSLKNGDRRAFKKLGYRYLTGDTVNKNESAAYKYFAEAAKDKDPEAWLVLGKLHRDGIGVEKSKGDSAKFLFKAADAGVREAQYNYALYLLETEYYGEAFKYFNLSISNLKEDEDINADALYNIANLYAQGKGVTQDRKTAFMYYYKAFEMGNFDAKDAVAECYFKGNGVPVNKKAAIRLNPKYAE